MVNCYNLYCEFHTYRNSLKIEEIARDTKFIHFKEKMPNDIGMLTLYAHIYINVRRRTSFLKL